MHTNMLYGKNMTSICGDLATIEMQQWAQQASNAGFDHPGCKGEALFWTGWICS